MNQRIVLQELANPINSNFSDESFTGGLVCIARAAVEITIDIAVYVIT